VADASRYLPRLDLLDNFIHEACQSRLGSWTCQVDTRSSWRIDIVVGLWGLLDGKAGGLHGHNGRDI
jgi:hypothetical protein